MARITLIWTLKANSYASGSRSFDSWLSKSIHRQIYHAVVSQVERIGVLRGVQAVASVAASLGEHTGDQAGDLSVEHMGGSSVKHYGE